MHIDNHDTGYVIVKANLIFNRDDLLVLSTCAKAHYDLRCQGADSNGIVNAIRNSFDDDHAVTWGVVVDSQDIGLMRKILEVSGWMHAKPTSQHFREVANDLDIRLKEMLKLMGETTRRYNNQLMQDLHDPAQVLGEGNGQPKPSSGDIVIG